MTDRINRKTGLEIVCEMRRESLEYFFNNEGQLFVVRKVNFTNNNGSQRRGVEKGRLNGGPCEIRFFDCGKVALCGGSCGLGELITL